MTETIDFLTRHGPLILFVWIFADQLGVPVPAVPVLLAVGALAGAGRISFWVALGASIPASLLADLIWYGLGRARGRGILRLLCRITLAPDSCVRQTETMFLRYGAPALLVTKLVPGLNSVASPLSGAAGVPLFSFVAYSVGGAVVWISVYAGVGYLAGDALNRVAGDLEHVGSAATVAVVAVVLGYVGVKWARRWQFLRGLRGARMTVDELKARLDRGEPIAVFDLRSPLDVAALPSTIPGARWISAAEFEDREFARDVPADRDVVLFCTCPNEATSARVALRLHGEGLTRIRPLAGGLDAWREHKFPLVPMTTPAQGAGIGKRVAQPATRGRER
jgi:membrane protein DedA with SNARE-associated domain/rhodanese-related sulfurtransferase